MSKTNENKYKIIKYVLNVGIIFFLLMFAIYLSSPLFGGILSYSALIFYASLAGLGFVAKYIINLVENKKSINKYQVFIITMYEAICCFLWFDIYIALFMLALAIILNIVGYIAYSKNIVFIQTN
ncbi:MAG: hypothetical protein ACYDBT_03570 [Desulfobulbaceae bacterium]